MEKQRFNHKKEAKSKITDLEMSLICAVTHNIDVCDSCRKCGNNCAEIRVELVKRIKKMFKEQRRSNMKKYKVTWYVGSIEKIETILNEAIVEANNIREVNINSVVSKDVLKNSYYQRCILWSDNKITVDYGSHSMFVEIKLYNPRRKK